MEKKEIKKFIKELNKSTLRVEKDENSGKRWK